MKLTLKQAIERDLIPDFVRAGASQLLFFAGGKNRCQIVFKHLRLHSGREGYVVRRLQLRMLHFAQESGLLCARSAHVKVRFSRLSAGLCIPG
jgi:hypothetical protein